MANGPAIKSMVSGFAIFRFLHALAFSLTFIIIAGLTNPAANAADLAVSLPLSGDYAQLGKQFSTGVKLALEEVPESQRPEILTVDDGCSDEQGKSAASQIAASDVRLVFGYLCNEPAFAAARELIQSGIPVLVTGARAGRLTRDTQREGWNVFRASPSDAQAPTRASQIFAKRWKGKRYAILDDGSLFSRTWSDEMRAWMEEAGIPPAFVATYRPELERQSAMIAKLLAEKIDAVFIAGTINDFLTFAREIQVVDPQMEIAGTETLDLLPLEGAARELEGRVLLISMANPANLPQTKSLLEYLLASDIEPDPMIFKGYAATRLALAALGKDRAETLSNLKNKEFDTLLGPVQFDKDGANIHNPFNLFVFSDGKITPAE